MPDASDFATYARLLRLTPLDDAPRTSEPQEAVAEPSPASVKHSPWHALGGAVRRYVLGGAAIFVLLPTLLATLYFALFAADRFASEARFVVRMPGATSTNAAVASLMQSAGVTQGVDEALIIRDYLESRDAMTYLEKHAGLREAAAHKSADFLWRYPNFFTSNTQEGLFWHYERLLSVALDTTTGVTTLRMQAFSPQEAQRLTTHLLDAAEDLVNRLNARARNDAIAFAEAEVDRMRARAVEALSKLTAFREREALIDPSHATLAILEAIGRLSQEVAQVNVQIRELQSGSPAGPQIGALRTRQAALEAQIAAERHRLAGDSASIAPRIAEYEQLMLEREFAERALMAALTAVEMARIEAQRQHVYVERVAAPSLPDHPTYPLRLVWILATLAISYAVFRIGKVLVDDARSHADP